MRLLRQLVVLVELDEASCDGIPNIRGDGVVLGVRGQVSMHARVHGKREGKCRGA